MNKCEIISIILRKINEKVQYIEELILSIRESNTDTKSSMGDKYETSREMLQQEINQLQKQVSETVIQKESILKMKIRETPTASLGAVIETTMGVFFISTGIGEIFVHNKKIICISTLSPLAKSALGKKKGDFFLLNGEKIIINDVF